MALGVEEAVNRGFTEIHIYGATGGRLDHFMGVLQILQKPKYIEQNIIIIVEDLQNEIKLLKQGIHEIHKLQSYPYVSFIPVNEVVALSLNGFKYNLNNQPLEKGSHLHYRMRLKRKLHKSKYMMDKSYKLEVEMQIKIKQKMPSPHMKAFLVHYIY